MDLGPVLRELRDIPVIDTHEHIRIAPELRIKDLPALVVNSYLGSDLEACGMDLGVFEAMPSETDAQREARWKVLKPFLAQVRTTSYYRYVHRTMEINYGLKGPLNDGNWRDIDLQVRGRNGGAEAEPVFNDWYTGYLETAKVRHILLDPYWDSFNTEMELDRASPVHRVNALVLGNGSGARDHMELSGHEKAKEHGVPLERLDDYKDFICSEMDRFKSAGSRAVKSALAYDRTIRFEPVTDGVASMAYQRGTGMSFEERHHLEDHLFHYIAEQCGVRDIPFQIHTGILAGSGRLPQGAHPYLLDPVIRAHPETRFDIFHGGYPWASELALMPKVYSNVSLDLCWFPLISRTVCERALHEWLDTSPHTKLFWGGDLGAPEHLPGAVDQAKEVVARVLVQRVEQGVMEKEDVLDIARGIFLDNPTRYFGI